MASAVTSGGGGGITFRGLIVNPSIIRDIDAERVKQDAKWGGPKHDDELTIGEWAEIIARRAAMSSVRDADGGFSRRHRLIQVAALAVAAIDSYDRVNGYGECSDDGDCGRDEWLLWVKADRQFSNEQAVEARYDGPFRDLREASDYMVFSRQQGGPCLKGLQLVIDPLANAKDRTKVTPLPNYKPLALTLAQIQAMTNKPIVAGPPA